MKIAVIAWGSVVWDRQNLAAVGEFKPAGPWLPIEFCRISRDGRLTLVIDDNLGTPSATWFAVSAFGNLDSAIENLREREGMPSASDVGFIVPASGRKHTKAIDRHAQAIKAIAGWVDGKRFDAAIWTALASNFAERTNEPFCVQSAIRYLEKRDAKTLNNALTYIRRAPPTVQTPTRTAVKARWPESSNSTSPSM